jgi:hypothetical protein
MHLHVPRSRAIRADRRMNVRFAGNMLVIAIAGVALLAQSPVLALAYATVITAIVVAYRVVHRQEAQRFMVDNQAALAALARGDFATAEDAYRRWALRTRVPGVSALARHNLAWTLMRKCDFAASLAVLRDNDERNSKVLRRLGLYATNAIDRGIDHALLGELRDAERCANEARRRLGGAVKNANARAKLVLVEAVIACRSGRAEEGVRAIEDIWAESESLLTGELVRPLRVVRAFAMSQAGPRDAGLAHRFIVAARPNYPGEYDFLATAWPEMAQFLDVHELR